MQQFCKFVTRRFV